MTLSDFQTIMYRQFIQGTEKAEYMKFQDMPDPLLWKDSRDFNLESFVEYPDRVIYGRWTGPTCFQIEREFNLRHIEEYFQKEKLDTSMIDHEMLKAAKERAWAYFNMLQVERFQEDTEVIHEGIINIRTYFDDNSLQMSQHINAETGEVIREVRFIKGQFFDEENNRPVSFLKSYYKFQDGKEVYADLRKNAKGVKNWYITFPLQYAGTTLESIYLNRIYHARSAKRTTTRNKNDQ